MICGCGRNGTEISDEVVSWCVRAWQDRIVPEKLSLDLKGCERPGQVVQARRLDA